MYMIFCYNNSPESSSRSSKPPGHDWHDINKTIPSPELHQLCSCDSQVWLVNLTGLSSSPPSSSSSSPSSSSSSSSSLSPGAMLGPSCCGEGGTATEDGSLSLSSFSPSSLALSSRFSASLSRASISSIRLSSSSAWRFCFFFSFFFLFLDIFPTLDQRGRQSLNAIKANICNLIL